MSGLMIPLLRPNVTGTSPTFAFLRARVPVLGLAAAVVIARAALPEELAHELHCVSLDELYVQFETNDMVDSTLVLREWRDCKGGCSNGALLIEVLKTMGL